MAYVDFLKFFDQLQHSLSANAFMSVYRYHSAFKITPCSERQLHTYVEYGGVKSHKHRSTSGVRQESVFGPLLFLIFINYITTCFSSLYAKNLKMYETVKTLSDGGQLQADLEFYALEWINIARCKTMSFITGIP